MTKTKFSELWESVKQFYQEKFGIAPELVDVMADFYVLKLCATGASNSSIAHFLDMEVEIVGEIIDRNFGFTGWDNNLDFNPLRLYKSMNEVSKELFRDRVIEDYKYVEDAIITRMFDASALVNNLERLLDENWI